MSNYIETRNVKNFCISMAKAIEESVQCHDIAKMMKIVSFGKTHAPDENVQVLCASGEKMIREKNTVEKIGTDLLARLNELVYQEEYSDLVGCGFNESARVYKAAKADCAVISITESLIEILNKGSMDRDICKVAAALKTYEVAAAKEVLVKEVFRVQMHMHRFWLEEKGFCEVNSDVVFYIYECIEATEFENTFENGTAELHYELVQVKKAAEERLMNREQELLNVIGS